MKNLLLTYIPSVSGILLIISYIPQLYTTFTTQNVEGQNVYFWVLLSLACAGFALQQFGMIKYEGLKSYSGFVAQVMNTLLAVAMLVMILLFK